MKFMIPRKYTLVVFFFLSVHAIGLFGQVPVITTPQPGMLLPGTVVGNSTNKNNPAPNTPSFPGFTNNNRQALDMYESDRLEVQRRNAEMQQMHNED